MTSLPARRSGTGRALLFLVPCLTSGCELLVGGLAYDQVDAARPTTKADATVRDGSGASNDGPVEVEAGPTNRQDAEAGVSRVDANDAGAAGQEDAHDADAAGARDGAPRDGDASDARHPGIDASGACPSLCAEAGLGTCDPSGTCGVACTAAGTCTGPVACPAGIPCLVTCTGAGSCTAAIDCTAASACVIQCIGAGSCTGSIACGGSSCSLACTGAGSCTGRVVCDAASCDIGCSPGCE